MLCMFAIMTAFALSTEIDLGQESNRMPVDVDYVVPEETEVEMSQYSKYKIFAKLMKRASSADEMSAAHARIFGNEEADLPQFLLQTSQVQAPTKGKNLPPQPVITPQDQPTLTKNPTAAPTLQCEDREDKVCAKYHKTIEIVVAESMKGRVNIHTPRADDTCTCEEVPGLLEDICSNMERLKMSCPNFCNFVMCGERNGFTCQTKAPTEPPSPPPPPTIAPTCEQILECESKGDPHYNTFTGKKFDFQQPGEYLLFDSASAGLALTTYQCPWITKFVGTTSNIAAVVTAGAHQIEISGPDDYKICNAKGEGCKSYGLGTHKLTDGVTATFTNPRRRSKGRSKFVIKGPTLEGQCGQHGEVWGFLKKWGKEKIPTGYFWNLYGLLPKSHALAVQGLCKSEDTCTDIHKANPRVAKAKVMFQVETLDQLSKTCSGNCTEVGRVPPECNRMKTQCELEACDNPEKLKKCHCKKSDEEEGEKICAKNACPKDVDDCVIDYCVSGGATDDVVATYKDMQVDACENACEQCEEEGKTCKGGDPELFCATSTSCDPECISPEPVTTPVPGPTIHPSTFVPTCTLNSFNSLTPFHSFKSISNRILRCISVGVWILRCISVGYNLNIYNLHCSRL